MVGGERWGEMGEGGWRWGGDGERWGEMGEEDGERIWVRMAR